MPTHAGSSAPTVALLLILATFTAVAYAYHASAPSSPRPVATIGDLTVESFSVALTGLHEDYLGAALSAVVYNPNPFGATLEGANYSVFVDGRFLGSGRAATSYYMRAGSSQTFVFPIDLGWASALGATGSYAASLGSVSWEVRGTAEIRLAGQAISVPFELTT